MRLGELNKKPTNGATLDELLVRIKTQLTKLGPILGLEVMPPSCSAFNPSKTARS